MISPYEQQRQALIQSFQSRGITNAAVLNAMASVDRELFVSPAMKQRAYEDSALPIDAKQTISQPYTVAFMTEALNVRPGSKVLEIGTGSGYQAAVLAELGCDVYTIERHEVLSRRARQTLEQVGYKVKCRVGDGTIGWSEHAPYDGIIVTAGAPDVPEALAKQLSIGGHLVVPVGERDEQSLYRVTRNGPEDWSAEDLGPFRFVPLIGRQGWQGE